MAGVGKSTIGKELAKFFNYNFIDTDNLIKEKNKTTPQEMIDSFGEDSYLQKEEEVILGIGNVFHTVIATGGSCVYSEKAMKLLKKISIVIFLQSPYENIKKRISDLNTRGIVGLREKTLKELYNERLPLYRRYADKTIVVRDDFKEENIIAKIESFVSSHTDL